MHPKFIGAWSEKNVFEKCQIGTWFQMTCTPPLTQLNGSKGVRAI